MVVSGNVVDVVKIDSKVPIKIGTELTGIVSCGIALVELDIANLSIFLSFRFLLIVMAKGIKIIAVRMVYHLQGVGHI